jgi:hypothetical protein
VRSWFVPPRRTAESAPAPAARATEALSDQVVSAGGGFAYGAGGLDPVDGDYGFRPAGTRNREVPYWTREKARTYSVTAYRTNPMARAIIDTYTSFCVGDSGLALSCPVPEVRDVADRFWRDSKNRLHTQDLQRLLLQDHLLMGETALELMAGGLTGVVRFSPIDTDRIVDVELLHGNPLWPGRLFIRVPGADALAMTVMQADDITGRRDGQVAYWASFKALLTDRRGDPFLMPILDDIDAYGQVMSNLIDRTALLRHIAFDVEVDGDAAAVDEFVARRGGTHFPRSGTIEVHNGAVKWTPMQAQVGSEEDKTTAGQILTSVAGGAGLAKTWLAEPDGANRATSLSMAEPVRRRVGGVQALWLEYQTDFVVDRAVAAGRLPLMVDAPTAGSAAGHTQVPAAQTVSITGPEVAAADAQVTAQVLVNLSTALTKMVAAKILSPEAAKLAARKGWEQFAGVPYTSDLDGPDANVDDVATAVDDATPKGRTAANNLMGAAA